MSTILCGALAGCGGPVRTDVTGRVTYNGKPLDKPYGAIVFVAPDGRRVTAQIDVDGTYVAPGVSIGENRVSVAYDRPPPPPGKRAPDTKGPGSSKTSPFITPDAYADPETSKLSVKVEKGTVYNPELTGPAIK
jgi:hypothetical protein